MQLRPIVLVQSICKMHLLNYQIARHFAARDPKGNFNGRLVSKHTVDRAELAERAA